MLQKIRFNYSFKDISINQMYETLLLKFKSLYMKIANIFSISVDIFHRKINNNGVGH